MELDVSVWRGNESGEYVSYRVPHSEVQTVLDVVSFVQRHLEPTLAYRFSCRVGMCGSCAMMVNDAPVWTCRMQASRAAASGRLKIGPLRNLPVIRDLVCDMTPFFAKWQRAGGYFVPSESRSRDLVRLPPDAPDRRAVDRGIECIGCAVCYAACDMLPWHSSYLGPAALNRASTLVNDRRDADQGSHLRSVADSDGCAACRTHLSCGRSCPLHLNPSASISALKRELVFATLRAKT